MVLSGRAIEERRNKGDIIITPWREEQLNPNSYNIRLGKQFMGYRRGLPGAKSIHKDPIPDVVFERNYGESFELQAGECVLAATLEYTETHNLVPMLEGRSSIGRQFGAIHVTAGFGDVGFKGHWTLEIVAFQNLTIWPGMEIGQIYYHTVEGKIGAEYSGRYQGDSGPQPYRRNK